MLTDVLGKKRLTEAKRNGNGRQGESGRKKLE